jgi:beta-N-acetylhexosaminidase
MADTCWDEAPLGRVCGQLILGGFAGPELPSEYAAALRSGRRAGVILFRRNLPDLETAASLCLAVTQAARPATAFVSVDQEGGRVCRLQAPVLGLPPMRALGARGDEALVRSAARLLGRQLRALGFNVDFAPVLDVDTRADNPVIGDRSFSSDPEVVARFGAAFASGLDEAGLLACGKHFPGHGDTALDSHFALPCVDHDVGRLRSVELVPFARLAATLPALMTAHVLYPKLDPDRPATLSPRVCSELLRHELGFRGVLFSDDLEMRALSGSVEERAVEAVQAGCDVLIISRNWELQERAHEALVLRAERDAHFRARCLEAARRSVTARERLLSVEPAPEHARELIRGGEAEQLLARLRAVSACEP